MFDYQAGEKYKLTLIMVGVAGLLAGMFFTMLLMPSPEPSAARKARMAASQTRAMSDPDVTGGYRGAPGSGYGASPMAAQAMAQQQQQAAPPQVPPGAMVDRASAKVFMDQWLQRVWDLSAQSAVANQESAISCMTPDCAAQYRSKVWTPEIAAQVGQSTLTSAFQVQSVDVSDNLNDGSVVVKVKGLQTLQGAGKMRSRPVNYEYMVKQVDGQMKIAGISDVSNATR